MPQSPNTIADDQIRYNQAWLEIDRLVRSGESWSGREKNCSFLNTGGGRFAGISAVSGIDFSDDGRGMALTDWDHDGDVDLWLTNRTAPRVRMMRNDMASGHHYIALRLEGRTSNRDAIGARVELILDDQNDKESNNKKNIKTLRAGEGFISQSSKWLHFGLGDQASIKQVLVHWPGGKTEIFTGLDADHHYRLVQNSGQAEAWNPPKRTITLKPSTLTPAESTGKVQSFLTNRAQLPVLKYETFDGQVRTLGLPADSPVLINFWAVWCPPCLNELTQWTEQEEEIRKAGLNIVALSVDGLDPSKKTTPQQAQAAIARIKFPFDSGKAHPDLLSRLQLTINQVFAMDFAPGTPMSILIDSEGRLAAVYRESVEIDRILVDVRNLKKIGEARRTAGSPFPGRWVTPARDGSLLLTTRIAEALQEFRTPKESTDYIDRILERTPDKEKDPMLLSFSGTALLNEKNFPSAEARFREAIALDPMLANAHLNLGVALFFQNRPAAAIKPYKDAIQLLPEDAEAHQRLGEAYTALSRVDDAIVQYRRALEITPNLAKAHTSLGIALAFQGDLKDLNTAIEHFRQALTINPTSANANFSLAQALIHQQKLDEAIKHIRIAIAGDRDFLRAITLQAWDHASHSDPRVIKPKTALALAELAAELSEHRDSGILDTLAAAYATVGDFDKAISTSRKTIELAAGTPHERNLAQFKTRLKLYQLRKPYRQPTPRKR